MSIKKKSTWFFSIGLCTLMLTAAIAAKHYTPTEYMADTRHGMLLEKVVPEAFGQWQIDSSITPLVVDPSQLELADRLYSQTVARTYVDQNGRRVMLTIAYGKDQSDGLQVHTPEACYPVAGFQVTPSNRDWISLGAANQPVIKLVAEKDGQKEPISYWVTVGDYVVNDGPRGRRNVRFSYGFKGKIPDGLLFRISSRGQDLQAQYELQARFAKDLHDSLNPDVADWLFGKHIYAD